MNALSDYASILIGLFFGTLAHFGRLLSGGEMPTFRQTIGFLMQLGLVGIIAAVATRKLGINDDDMRALTTAVLAISAQEVIQYLRRTGWKTLARAALSGDDKPDDVPQEQKQ